MPGVLVADNGRVEGGACQAWSCRAWWQAHPCVRQLGPLPLLSQLAASALGRCRPCSCEMLRGSPQVLRCQWACVLHMAGRAACCRLVGLSTALPPTVALSCCLGVPRTNALQCMSVRTVVAVGKLHCSCKPCVPGACLASCLVAVVVPAWHCTGSHAVVPATACLCVCSGDGGAGVECPQGYPTRHGCWLHCVHIDLLRLNTCPSSTSTKQAAPAPAACLTTHAAPSAPANAVPAAGGWGRWAGPVHPWCNAVPAAGGLHAACWTGACGCCRQQDCSSPGLAGTL